MKPKITVVGSINIDLTVKIDHWLEPGETITGYDYVQTPGGKGANQAVAAARLGADVKMLGKIGEDALGETALANFRTEGVDVTDVEPVTHGATGMAFITLAEQDNQIIVVPGANHEVTPEWVAAQEAAIKDSNVVILQLEIPLESVKAAAKIAKSHNVPIILNPAPYQKLDDELLGLIDILTPNEHEYRELESRLEHFRGTLVVTRGAAGVSIISENGSRDIPGYTVDVTDTTGAGDTFNGALAVKWAETGDIDEAVRYAVAASALSVTKLGAQSGMPTARETASFIAERGGRL